MMRVNSGESRPKGGGGGGREAFEGSTMNVKFYEDNSSSAEKMPLVNRSHREFSQEHVTDRLETLFVNK